ncbi:hypothetical protein ACIRBX_20340 [Kitasatospora sp. NPDC096147]|uniref:hypothetical protein n=1 Tax=Kitasatospora sp. NPDC096147 TaxID=3364093 RepID=UPI0038078EF2
MTNTIRRHSARLLAAGLLAATATLASAPLAQAADPAPAAAPAQLAPTELGAARAAAEAPSVTDQLGRFFARKGVPPNQSIALSPADEARAAAQAAPRLSGDTVPVYLLDPGFVAGTPGAPVARAEFTASKAVAADGQVASVWTAKQGAGWRVVNIATGGDETDYAAQAASTGGGTAFREPQIDAWYVLRGGRVLPLDEDARKAVGAGVSLADYQQQVRQRYGDKLPGSAYDRAGKGGGYQAAPVAEPDGPSLLTAGTAGAALLVTALTGLGLRTARQRARR